MLHKIIIKTKLVLLYTFEICSEKNSRCNDDIGIFCYKISLIKYHLLFDLSISE